VRVASPQIFSKRESLPHEKSSRRGGQARGAEQQKRVCREGSRSVPTGGEREKGRILDEFVATSGYHRVYARQLLSRAAAPRVSQRRQRQPTYGSAEVGLLRICWEVADGICSKRLAPFLGQLLERLVACDMLPEEVTPELVARVAGMSAATIDRALGRHRDVWPKRRRGSTKPGTLLKHQIPISTFAEWDDSRPGFLEVDLVAHCGASGAGEFLFTLSTVDVATGWSACAGVQNKGEYATFQALRQLRSELPFPLLGIDSDNGGEFINRSLTRYCEQEGISFTRARPYRKNDNCHVEQKNWSVVRRLVGYARFEREALPALNRVHALARDFVNFFQPVHKLRHKTRSGAKVTKQYDQAKTPHQRLLATGLLPADVAANLEARYAELNPLKLKLDLEAAQQRLYTKTAQQAQPPRSKSSYGKILK
jgi:hypothetical protein